LKRIKKGGVVCAGGSDDSLRKNTHGRGHLGKGKGRTGKARLRRKKGVKKSTRKVKVMLKENLVFKAAGKRSLRKGAFTQSLWNQSRLFGKMRT